MRCIGYLKTLLLMLGIFVIHGAMITGCTSKNKIEVLAPTTVYKIGVSTPLELIYFEAQGNEESGQFYLSELTMMKKNKGIISFRELETERKLEQKLVLDSENGISIEQGASVDTDLNDFVFQNYTEWCGKWHNGIRRRWRMCTGLDCGEGLAICFQRELPGLP